MSFIASHLFDLHPGPDTYDEVIDVRAPCEFSEDHVPGARNLPVLTDDERARVGTIYKQDSPFMARKIGAALVARNAARHIEEVLHDRPGGWRPLVYCWRGGQRSNSLALILRQIGWRVAVLEGGYKAYRKLVVSALYDTPVAPRVVVLDGNTGTAKTELLMLLGTHGVQVLNLEGLARHRGSVFGDHAGGQPSQRAFEGALADALVRLDPARPVVVEAESSRIGTLRVPPQLWRAMGNAPRIEVSAPRPARATYLVQAYGDMVADPDRLARTLARLHMLHGAQVVARWQALAVAEHFAELADDLMAHHYDAAYARARLRMPPPDIRLETPGLGPSDLDTLAFDIAQAAKTLAASARSA